MHVFFLAELDHGYLNATYQGTSDEFYQQGQLLPENFLKAARAAGYDEFQVRVRSQEGYDHSYYFVRIPHSGRMNVH